MASWRARLNEKLGPAPDDGTGDEFRTDQRTAAHYVRLMRSADRPEDRRGDDLAQIEDYLERKGDRNTLLARIGLTEVELFEWQKKYPPGK